MCESTKGFHGLLNFPYFSRIFMNRCLESIVNPNKKDKLIQLTKEFVEEIIKQVEQFTKCKIQDVFMCR